MGDVSRRLVEQVKNAASTETGLNIVCRGTKEFMGRMPAGQAISVVEHSGIIEYLPVELVITARAGTSLEEIAATLDEHDQMLAFEPPTFAGRASIGGTLACNLSGPARPWSGGIRDSLLGLRIINGKGEHLKFGGKVMKNVAGYDVSRLQAGAAGNAARFLQPSRRAVAILSQVHGGPFQRASGLAHRLGGCVALVASATRCKRFRARKHRTSRGQCQWPGDVVPRRGSQ